MHITILYNKRGKELINKYIIKDNAINSGKATIRGTRVTPEDIGNLLISNENIGIKDIIKEYPSLSKEEEVVAGMIYYFNKEISLIKILF